MLWDWLNCEEGKGVGNCVLTADCARLIGQSLESEGKGVLELCVGRRFC